SGGSTGNLQLNFHKVFNEKLDIFIDLQFQKTSILSSYTLSQMLRKSIETRDWLNTIEPRHVRSVMKRIIEDLTQIDKHVKMLYHDQQSSAPITSSSSSYGRYSHRSNLISGGGRSSDGGRRTIIMPRSSALDRTTSGGPGSSGGSTGNLQLNFHKVFNEKLDIFIDLQFQKTSILS
ncbi:unnamed protein product, partial [Rotaria sp. Silwood2]